jgi:PurA ssDNA and RNA-binding protein
MISNERPSPYGHQPYFQRQYQQPRPRPPEETLLRAEFPVERKLFILSLKENPRGRFLRIIEDTGSDRRPPVSIIIPATGLKDFQKLLADMVKAESEIPQKKDSPAV